MKSLNFKNIYLIAGLLAFCINISQAQKVGINTTSVPADAVLNINGNVSGSYKGMIPPKMTTVQRDGIGANTDGLTIYNTQAKAYQVFDGANWNNIGIPSGAIVMWSGSTSSIPGGWVLCNGSNGTPDLRERFVVGAGGDNSNVAGGAYAVDATGGVDEVTLTVGELPSHSHDEGSLVTESTGSHQHAIGRSFGTGTERAGVRYGTSAADPGTTNSAGNHTHNITGSTGNVGSGNAHENRPPYLALAYIMKI